MTPPSLPKFYQLEIQFSSVTIKRYMKSHFIIILTLLLIQMPLPTLALSDKEIKEQIIKKSIVEYKKTKGNCPCPYNTDARDYKCGKRSAYSKPRGESPICYPEDISNEMVKQYRQKT